MGEQRVERKLAAILAADVVGYSRLMGANEVGTLRALKTLRKACARRGCPKNKRGQLNIMRAMTMWSIGGGSAGHA